MSDDVVARARGRFESFAVENVYTATFVLDKAAFLRRPGSLCNGDAAGAEHHTDELLRKDELVTEHGKASGIELRRGTLALDAEWRMEGAARDLPAVGWSEDVQSLSARLHLPRQRRLGHVEPRRGLVDAAMGDDLEEDAEVVGLHVAGEAMRPPHGGKPVPAVCRGFARW